MIARAVGVSGTRSHHISTSVSFAIIACCTGFGSAPRRSVRLIHGMMPTPALASGPYRKPSLYRCGAAPLAVGWRIASTCVWMIKSITAAPAYTTCIEPSAAAFSEHRVVNGRLLRDRLDDVPVLNDLAVLKPEDIHDCLTAWIVR